MPRLSVIVPAYNEAATIETVMRALSSACPDAQIVYVNDGSKDDTLEIMKGHVRPQDIVVDKPNGGKGSAIREGLTQATGDYTVIQDADLEYDPAEIRLLRKRAGETPGPTCGPRAVAGLGVQPGRNPAQPPMPAAPGMDDLHRPAT